MQIQVDDLDKIRALSEAQKELIEIKEREMSLRREVAQIVMGSKNIMPGRKTVTLGDTKIMCEYKEVLKVLDTELLGDYVDDDSLPEDTVTLKPQTTLAKMKKVPIDHPIWDAAYTDVSPTPTVKIEDVS